MTTSNKSLVGPGRFQWNTGGWFGASLGGSAWMILVAGFLVFHDQPTLALIPAVGFPIVLLISLLLWACRTRIYPFPALMALLGLVAISVLLVVIVVPSYASPEALAAMNWPASTGLTILASAIAPSLMIWFLFVEWSVTTNLDTKTLEIHK